MHRGYFLRREQSRSRYRTNRICPYLLGLSSTEVSKPLAEFQAVNADQDGTRKLVKSVNKSLNQGALDDDKLDRAFTVWWPELKVFIEGLQEDHPVLAHQTNQEEKTLEILGSVREILRRLDQDRAYYGSADAMRKEMSAMKELREDWAEEEQ